MLLVSISIIRHNVITMYYQKERGTEVDELEVSMLEIEYSKLF